VAGHELGNCVVVERLQQVQRGLVEGLERLPVDDLGIELPVVGPQRDRQAAVRLIRRIVRHQT
jgi:hypothetical protein